MKTLSSLPISTLQVAKIILAIFALLTMQSGFAKKLNVDQIDQALKFEIRKGMVKHYASYAQANSGQNLNLLEIGKVLLVEHLIYPDYSTKTNGCSNTCTTSHTAVAPKVPERLDRFFEVFYLFELRNGDTTATTTTEWFTNKFQGATKAYYVSLITSAIFVSTFKTFSNQSHMLTYSQETAKNPAKSTYPPNFTLKVGMNSSRTVTSFTQYDFSYDHGKLFEATIAPATGNVFRMTDYACVGTLVPATGNIAYYEIKTCLQSTNRIVEPDLTATALAVGSSLVLTVSTSGELIDYKGKLFYYSTPTIAGYLLTKRDNNTWIDSVTPALKQISGIQHGDYIDLYDLRLFEPEISTVSVTANSLQLKWTPKPLYEYYQVYKKDSITPLNSSVLTSPTRTFTNISLNANTTYTYYVVSCKQSTNCKESNATPRSDYFSFKTN